MSKKPNENQFRWAFLILYLVMQHFIEDPTLKKSYYGPKHQLLRLSSLKSRGQSPKRQSPSSTPTVCRRAPPRGRKV